MKVLKLIIIVFLKKKKKKRCLTTQFCIFYIRRQKERNIIYRIDARRAVNILSLFSIAARNQSSDNFYSMSHCNVETPLQLITIFISINTYISH